MPVPHTWATSSWLHMGVCVGGGRPVHCCVSGTQQGLSLSLGSHIPSLSPAAARTHLVVRCTTKTGLKRLGGVGSCVHVVNPCACPPHTCVHTAAPRLQQGAPAGLTASSCNWGVSPTHMGPLKEDRGGGGGGRPDGGLRLGHPPATGGVAQSGCVQK